MSDERGGVPEVLAEDLGALRPKRTWPKFVLMHLTILVVGVSLLRHYRKVPHRPRVLVAIEVEGAYYAGSEPAEILAERFGEKAASLGLEIVHPRDKDALAVLQKSDLKTAAQQLDAAYVLVGKTRVEAIAYPLANAVAPYYDVRGEVDLVLTVPGEPDVPCGTLSALVGAPDRTLALRGVAESLADQAIDLSVGPMLRSPSTAKFSTLKTSKGEAVLAPAFSWLSARERGRARRAGRLRARGLEARKAGEKGPPPGHLRGCALGARRAARGRQRPRRRDGGHPHDPLVRDATTWIPAPAAAGGAVAAGRAARTLYRGAGVFAFPHEAAPPLVLVEDLFGYARSLTVVESNGLRRLQVDPDHRWDGPRVSPDGRHVVVQDRPCATCAAELVVFALGSGKAVFRVQGDAFHGFTWLDPGGFVFVHRSKDKDPKNPALAKDGLAVFPVALSPSGDTATLGGPFVVPDDELWTSPTAQGGKIAFERRSGDKGIAVLEWATFAVSKRAAGVDARALSWGPDGRIAFELHDPKLPEEIAVAAEDGAVTALTKNLVHDRGPRFSPDGKRVWFTSEADDPWFPGQRTVSWVAWVAP